MSWQTTVVKLAEGVLARGVGETDAADAEQDARCREDAVVAGANRRGKADSADAVGVDAAGVVVVAVVLQVS